MTVKFSHFSAADNVLVPLTKFVSFLISCSFDWSHYSAFSESLFLTSNNLQLNNCFPCMPNETYLKLHTHDTKYEIAKF